MGRHLPTWLNGTLTERLACLTNASMIGQCGIVINLAGLSGITFNSNRTQASIEGGVSVQALVDTAYENEARISTATCNCLGFLGAALGAGLSRTAGLYGLSADQLLSMDIVMASGALRHVDGRNTDLWWALKGAGPNFGIVTSAVVKANPVPRPENIAWQGALIFSEDKLEALIRTINGLYLTPHMQIDFLFAAQPNGTPFIRVVPFYVGNTSAGRAAFKSILDLGPTTDSTREFPYNEWNAFGNYGCVSAGRKPAYGVSINHLDPLTWYTLYENFKTFVAAYPEAFNSSIFVETYPVNSSTIQKGTGAFPWRKAKTHVSVFPWYANASLDNAANAWGRTTRTLLRSTDGIPGHAKWVFLDLHLSLLVADETPSYINFAHGDESLKNIYGASLSRLRTLKKRYDPSNRFNQWFPIH